MRYLPINRKVFMLVLKIEMQLMELDEKILQINSEERNIKCLKRHNKM